MERAVLQTDADRYVIVTSLAEGGMGAIYLGKKIGIGGFKKDVVLKQLLPEFTSQPEFIDLFLREARISASLDHANIVHTLDLVTAGSDYYIVMEYVHGADLRTIMRRVKQRHQHMAPAAALFVGREILSALGYAHDKKRPDGSALALIHRDVSPSNIMLSGAGEVKLTDFGIAKASTHKSVFYKVKGKVGYMSPEQAYADRPIDHRSDLYSLAVVLYEMLAGERLFVADLLSLPKQIYSQGVPDLEGRADMPAGVDAVLGRALALDPDQRYQTASDFADALAQISIDNGLIFNAPALAGHLRETCGDDPEQWRKVEEQQDAGDGPGTEVLVDDRPLSGVELTSVLTDVAFAEESSTANGFLVSEPTRYMKPKVSRDRTLTPPPESVTAAGAITAGDAPFDGSDGHHERTIDTPEEPPTVTEASHAEALADTVHAREALDAPETEEQRGGTPQAWSEEDELTLAFTGTPAEASRAPEVSLPRASLTPAPRPARYAREPVQPAPSSARRAPAAERPGAIRDQRRGPTTRPTPSPAPALRPAQATGVSLPRSRLAMLVAAGALLVAAIAIVVVVGLSGPSMETPIALPPPRTPTSAGSASAAGKTPAAKTPAKAAGSGLLAKPHATAKTGNRLHPGKSPAADGASLTVETRPDGAQVLIDGVAQCRAACTIEGLDPDRVYLLSVRRRTYVSWSQLVDMKGRREARLSVSLRREPKSRDVGYLVVRCTPVANVAVNGKPIGRVTSQGRIPLREGQHEISLSNPRSGRKLSFLVNIYRQRITTTEPMKL